MSIHDPKKIMILLAAFGIWVFAFSVGAQQQDTQERPKVNKTDAEWKSQLTAEQYKVTRKKGTERAFTGEHWNNKRNGVYTCVCCGEPLFDSKTKFESGTGWPSFYDVVSKKAVGEVEDNGLFVRRTEVICQSCDAHLGHVFDDGPKQTGLRYCVNSAALEFEERKMEPPTEFK